MASYKNERVWIVGASSGIGAALAQELDARGANLVLSARSVDKLEALRSELKGSHEISPLDITKQESIAVASISAFKSPVDRIVFLAAAYEPMWLKSSDLDTVQKIINTNLFGMVAFIKLIFPFLEEQGKGQIALCGSVAGYIGLPKGQPYSATKAATQSIAESLKSEVPSFIDVRLISPGFVKTPLTDKNDFTMPMVIEPKQAAIAIADGLRGKSFEIHFPKKFTFILKLLRLLPYWLSFKFIKRLA